MPDRDLDKACLEIITRMRRQQLIGLMEVLLGDLIALDGIEAAKKHLEIFLDQLRDY